LGIHIRLECGIRLARGLQLKAALWFAEGFSARRLMSSRLTQTETTPQGKLEL
jgi:hypothetical protein